MLASGGGAVFVRVRKPRGLRVNPNENVTARSVVMIHNLAKKGAGGRKMTCAPLKSLSVG